jgi:hypothetical protein
MSRMLLTRLINFLEENNTSDIKRDNLNEANALDFISLLQEHLFNRRTENKSLHMAEATLSPTTHSSDALLFQSFTYKRLSKYDLSGSRERDSWGK